MTPNSADGRPDSPQNVINALLDDVADRVVAEIVPPFASFEGLEAKQRRTRSSNKRWTDPRELAGC
jgi:hypothetical protein